MNLRVERIFREEMQGDTSFQQKGSFLDVFFGRETFSQLQMRETWNNGIKHGIEIGLNRASIQGQKIELEKNIDNEIHREFVEKLYKLAMEYKCAIQYHPEYGMTIIDRNYV